MEIRFMVEDVKFGGDCNLCLNLFDDFPSLTVEKEGEVIEELSLTDESMNGIVLGLKAMLQRRDVSNSTRSSFSKTIELQGDAFDLRHVSTGQNIMYVRKANPRTKSFTIGKIYTVIAEDSTNINVKNDKGVSTWIWRKNHVRAWKVTDDIIHQ